MQLYAGRRVSSTTKQNFHRPCRLLLCAFDANDNNVVLHTAALRRQCCAHVRVWHKEAMIEQTTWHI
jgi:hypothetical protein